MRLKKRTKKKTVGGAVAATAVATMTAAGVLVGGSFASPTEIMEDQPDAIVQTLGMGAQAIQDDGGGADPGEGDEAAEDEEKRGVRSSVRRFVQAAPSGVKAILGVPLWALGTALIALASTLWSAVLSPLAVTVLSWIGIALLAVLLFTLAVKTVCPDLPLKKILTRKTLIGIGVLCLVFGIADAALPFFWEDYQKLSQLLRVLGSLVCTGVPVAWFMRRQRRKKPEQIVAEPVEIPEPTPEEKENAARALIEEMADSVCPKLY